MISYRHRVEDNLDFPTAEVLLNEYSKAGGAKRIKGSAREW